MNCKFCGSILASACVALASLTGCSSSSTPTKNVTITTISGSGQKALTNAAFARPLTVKVTVDGTPTSGLQVTFTAPSSGATGTFVNGTATDTEMTDSSGQAISTTFTAGATAGDYAVTAAVDGTVTAANFNLTNATIAMSFSFYLSGLEVINCPTNGCNLYALAGVVALDADGDVVAGEQDYNDGFGITSPQPSGDSITGGSLTTDASGLGTLTLITNNANLGMSGTETLAVQFVNSNHALIAQFDGSATSSGSMDLQTAESAADGSFAFTLSGVNSSYFAVGAGGVFSISNGNITGTIDMNEPGGLHLDNPITATITSADNVGRGQIIGFNVNGIALALNYYVVGPEVIRIIDVDPGTDPSAGNVAVGSAFGQGSGSFSNASLKSSVFAVQGNPWTGIFYAGAGMIVPNAGTGKFTGVADENEEGSVVGAAAIFGTYTIGANGYGSLLITSGGLQDVTSFGLYATDPNLNLLDPNNTTGGGGALFLDLDPVLASGSGVVIPQTDSAANSFSGNYAFGAQDYNSTGALGYEFDYVGEGAVVEGVLTGTGAINDSFGFFSSTAAIYNAVPFSGSAAPDVANPGRYTMAPLDITAINGSQVPFSMAIYQASGGLLFWIDEDASSLSFGTLQQEKTASQVGRHSKKKLTARTQMHHKD